MNSFKLTIVNFKRNIKTYSMYLMAMIFSVASYYNFVSMRYNPQFLATKGVSQTIEGSSVTASMLMVLFLIFFIVYSTNFFLNQRKKEMGIYAFMGIDNYKIAFIFASEGLLLGITSLIVGLVLGILFSKLFLMMVAKVALLNMRIDFFISKRAIIETCIVYLIIFFLSFLKGYFDIVRTNLIDLMNTLKKTDELPRINYFKGILSLIIIGIAYLIAINYNTIGFGKALLWSVILVIVGTYWLFGSFFSMLIRYAVNRKSYLYNGTNIISISNIAFRIKDNYRTLAAVAVLITTCITSFGTVSSLKYFVDKNHKIEVPYTITFISDDEELIEKVNGVVENSNHNIELRESANFLLVEDSDVVVINLSTFQRILTKLDVKGGEKIISKLDDLNNEAIYVEKPGVLMSLIKSEDIEIGSKVYEIKSSEKVPLFGSGLPYSCIVVSNEEYEILKLSYDEKQFNGMILDRPEDTKELTLKLVEVLPADANLFTYYMAASNFYDYVGIVYFLGAFLFLVFVFATGSIIYFKVLSESFRDKNKFEILKKIGTTDLEIKQSISKQVEIFFLLPLIVGIIHSIVAIFVLSDIMEYGLVVPTIISIIVFIVAYSLFYVFTRRKYIYVIEQ